jgi:hypothetical protein
MSSGNVGIANGILCRTAGVGFAEAPGAPRRLLVSHPQAFERSGLQKARWARRMLSAARCSSGDSPVAGIGSGITNGRFRRILPKPGDCRCARGVVPLLPRLLTDAELGE